MTNTTVGHDLKLIAIACAAALLSAGCASTGSTSATPAKASATATAEAARPADAVGVQAASLEPNAIRCKRIAETGSRMKKKVCATNHEWEQSEQAAQQAAEEYQRGSSIGRGID